MTEKTAEKQLHIRWNAELVGTLTQLSGGALSFGYAEGWLAAPKARSISLSLPACEATYGNAVSRAFFGGYLPADREIRAELARILDTTKGDFALLSALGRDCAGALTVTPGTEAVVPDEGREPSYRALNAPELADCLRELERRPLLAGPHGLRLSLAGAQSKTAVYVDRAGRIGLTQDDYPTSHIVKPEISERLPDLALNEYLCLELGRRIGLDVPRVELKTVEGIPYLLIERYDRVLDEHGRVRRLHQEDFCQALAIPSQDKYQADGGPSLRDCFRVTDHLATPASDRLRLLDMVLFNVLIGNTDAHGKNYSILYDEWSGRLSPLYDVVCGVVYPQVIDTRLAMKVGGHYDADPILRRHWERFAEEIGFPAPALRTKLESITRRMQIHAPELERDLIARGQATGISRRIVDQVLRRTSEARAEFGLGLVPSDMLTSRAQVDSRARGRRAYERRYRVAMDRLADERRRADIGQESHEGASLGRRVSAAFDAWHRGESLESEQRILLEREVGAPPSA